jgi:choline kinase
MKAIILAAGRGNRLTPFTDDRPKCLLEFGGKSILDWQLGVLDSCGITDVLIVKGYRGELIVREGLREFFNPEYANTNMVASLFCAAAEVSGDILIVYADVLFERRLLRELLRAPAGEDIVVAVDTDWKDYYRKRFGSPYEEAEGLSFDSNRRLLSIGSEAPPISEVHGRFVGLLKLSAKGASAFGKLFQEARENWWDRPWMRGRSLKMSYMTDFLQALIQEGVPVSVLPVRRGWIELDSSTDYLNLLEWHRDGSLLEFFRLDE